MADLSLWPMRDALRFHQFYRSRRPGGHSPRQRDVVRYAGKLGCMILGLPGLPASYQLTTDGCLDAALLVERLSVRPDAAEGAMRVVDARLCWRGVVPETVCPRATTTPSRPIRPVDQRDGFVHFCDLFTSLPSSSSVTFKIWRAGQLAKRYTGCTGNIWDPQNPKPDRQAGPFRLVFYLWPEGVKAT
jgi:hypothetical protein